MKDPRFAEHLAVFADVVRGGSFSSAARRRSVTPSAIVRQIDGLEQDLGVLLLIRSTRSLALTDAGQRLFDRAQRLLDDLADARAEVAAVDQAVGGVLRIACFPTFGKRYVLPVLERLAVEHPQLRVELDLTERLADPVSERLDAVIRIGESPDSTLIATKIASQTRLLVASPHYLERFGTPDSIDTLTQHRLLDKLHGADLLDWSSILGQSVSTLLNDRQVFRCDDFEALRLAALAHLGIGLLPTWVVGPDIADGLLIRLSLAGEVWNQNTAGIYLLRALPQPAAKLRVFNEALRAHIGSPPIWEPISNAKAG